MPETWTYGEPGVAFDVKRGDLWRCGEHAVLCADVMDDLPDYLTAPVTLLYCDPPWNQSAQSSYYTKAGLERPAHDYRKLYWKLGQLVPPEIPVFLEGGFREAGHVRMQLDQELDGDAKLVIETWPTTYAGGSSAGILHYRGLDPPLVDPTGVDSAELPEHVLRAYSTVQGEQGIVLDPCAGSGTTLLAADRLGWHGIGCELNPHRVSQALYALERAGAGTPMRV